MGLFIMHMKSLRDIMAIISTMATTHINIIEKYLSDSYDYEDE